MIEILKPNENPFREGSSKALAWQIIRGFGGRLEVDCLSALDEAGLARHGDSQVGNRGYLRECHSKGLLILPGYEYKPRG